MLGSEPWGEGHVIAGKFRLTRRLGQGGMGSVWAADHSALHSAVAVKIIDPAIAKNADALARFMREAQAAAALRSPHVVQTFDYGVEDGVPFIAMELLEGDSLAQRLETVGHLSLEVTAQILTQVGRAISRAHDAGIIHRDLKPDNIFLVKNDDEEVAKVLDFGIAKDTGNGLGTSSQTRTGAILGTPYYMSPEQAEGNRSVDHRTDLWSLAIIAFECVTGRRPFESEALGELILQICVRPIPKPSSLAPVPPGFDEWFAKGTQRDPALRFQSSRDLSAQLRTAAGIQPTGTQGRGAAQSYVDLPREPAPTRHGTTGGVGALTHTSAGNSRASTPVIVGATVGAVCLVGAIAFFALRSSPEPNQSAASVSPVALPAPSVAATASPTEAVTAPPPSVVPAMAVVTPAAIAEPAVPAPKPAPLAASTRPATKAPRPSPAAKHGEGTSPSSPQPKHHVDFGF